ncbi:hypothetical protein ACFYTQ_31195 [Nocardia sp. NPDC004068]|uniref:hypothetical protein n=1 Tax=Nocardia sp. NPDC004068 TaxID=3364303 RepID=UPI0036847DDE
MTSDDYRAGYRDGHSDGFCDALRGGPRTPLPRTAEPDSHRGYRDGYRVGYQLGRQRRPRS